MADFTLTSLVNKVVFVENRLETENNMKKEMLRLAFIGGGINSAVGYVHFAATQLDAKFRVVAGVFSKDRETNQNTAQYWNIPKEKAYDNYEGMIENEEKNIDAVVILTPTPNHEEIIIYLLEKNIPIICEKAITCGLKELDQIKRYYNPDKHFLAVTYNYSGYAMVRELKHVIDCGSIGEVQKIHLEMPQEGFKRPPDIAGKKSKPQEWRLKDYEIPTICLDLGVHLHHLSSFLLGVEPNSVCANFSNHSDFDDLIDDVTMLLKYPNGISGTMWMSKTAIGHRNGLRIRVYGTNGSAEWFQLNPDELKINRSDGSREIIDRAGGCKYASLFRYNRMKPGHPTGFIEAFANLYSDIADALSSHLAGKGVAHNYVFGLEHSKNGLELFSAAKKSAADNVWTDTLNYSD